MWLIGNISGESSDLRDFVIQNIAILDCLERLIQLPRMTKTFLRTMCWVSSNLARYKNLTQP